MVEKTKALKCGVSLAVLMFSAGSACAGALPGNGHYVAGQGAIGKAGAIADRQKQSSTTGIIDWNNFSIGANRHVTFDNGSGATLNRVTGGNLSRIAGSLHATGSLYLLNSQGVIVSGTGRVVTGGNFVASTASGRCVRLQRQQIALAMQTRRPPWSIAAPSSPAARWR